MKKIIKILTPVLLIFSNIQAQIEKEPNPFTGIGSNSAESFSGSRMIFHGIGILSTYALVNCGADFRIHNFFVENGYSSYFDPAVGIGYLMPAVLSGGLYLYGKIQNSSPEIAAGSAALQAALVSLTFSTILKAITGRANPDPCIYSDDNASREFLFGFLRGGIHYGWPSGHLCTNTAVITSLIYFYNKIAGLKIAGSIYLGYLFYGILVHDNNTMHWFSDAVAGLLMGYAIGSTIGKNFRCELNNEQNSAACHELSSLNLLTIGGNNAITLAPFLSSKYSGLNIGCSF